MATGNRRRALMRHRVWRVVFALKLRLIVAGATKSGEVSCQGDQREGGFEGEERVVNRLCKLNDAFIRENVRDGCSR